MSLYGYKKTTRPALWKTMSGGLKPRGKTLVEVFSEVAKAAERKAKMDAHYAKHRAKPRKPIAQVSKVQRKKNTAYSVVAKQFKLEHPLCECCMKLFVIPVQPTDHVHHLRGRAGSLLTDVRFFKGVCFSHHAWIGDHPVEARAIGMLCADGEWGVPVPPDA